MKRQTILVVRSDDSFSRLLRDTGFDVLNLELIKTEQIADSNVLRDAIRQIGKYDGIFITSPVAAEIFVTHFNHGGINFSGKVYALGERAREVLSGSDLNVITGETANTARDLVESFDDAEFSGKNLLFIRGERSIRTIPQMLDGKAKVDELIVYRTIEINPDGELIKDIKKRFETNQIEWVCFFSPSGVTSFIKTFGDEYLTKIKGAAIGETTAQMARKSGIYINFISPRATAEDFAANLAAYIKSIE